MQKINIISCCAECSVHKLRAKRIPYCEKLNRRIDDSSEKFINPALVGFPEWCPLETFKLTGESSKDYINEIKEIIRIMSDDTIIDALAEASHYLNLIVENVKKDNCSECSKLK